MTTSRLKSLNTKKAMTYANGEIQVLALDRQKNVAVNGSQHSPY